KKIRHSKFLFAGYQIRSGNNSSARITIQESGKNLQLGASAHFDVVANGLQPRKGKLTVRDSSSKLATGLMKRFTKSQTYTTVRRSLENKAGVRINTVRKVSLTDAYPYLAWENPGSKYNFELKIGQQTQQISSTSDLIVRARISPFKGTKNYHINVLENGKVVASLQPYKSRGEMKNHSLTWLGDAQKADLEGKIDDIRETYGAKSFMLGSLFEKQDMWVAAMDQYQAYLNDNPDDIEMTPYLFRVYKRLKLNKQYKEGLINWQKAMKE
ncbi:MAG: hypothetical protein HOB38_24980, partial [Deltaproteobacteria bacterium]|nr:hypothetical protein [Deltaproteobacteria bacterium]